MLVIFTFAVAQPLLKFHAPRTQNSQTLFVVNKVRAPKGRAKFLKEPILSIHVMFISSFLAFGFNKNTFTHQRRRSPMQVAIAKDAQKP